MIKLQAILFDWGGTLASVRREDTVWRECSRAATDALHAQGVTPAQATASDFESAFLATREQVMADPQCRELNFRKFVQEWLSRSIGDPVSSGLIVAAEDAFWSAWTTCLDALDRPAEVLAGFKHRGLLLGVVSNVVAPANYCRTQLERLGLLEHLSALTFSSEVGRRKPHSSVYHDALRQLREALGAEPLRAEQILFVGDSPTCDVAGPAKLGMSTALITHPGVVPQPPAGDGEEIKPTYRVQHLDELQALLAGETPSSS